MDYRSLPQGSAGAAGPNPAFLPLETPVTATLPFGTPIPAGAPAPAKRDIKLGDFVAPHAVKAANEADEPDTHDNIITEAQPAPTGANFRRHARPTASNAFVTAWHLVHKAVKAEAPDTKV